ncbi:cold-inducible protein YdjO [Scopulibacillus darangshiensis]|uniref:Cold-inducible protein YdjO n=1 Tax=Scopulibacillus darangshiensis TaxID=442528 RepID=A0A4R2NYL8_9BACL|nr:cold-shock protein [Scopulibacillus darangshiensis]TCP26621.1 cold-inducible protein YdjO [Scopulibacillus darangshiensis]
MAFNKGPQEPVPEAETNVWSCTSESCSGWMRDDFSFEDHPKCPLCQAEMVKEVRVLPVLD